MLVWESECREGDRCFGRVGGWVGGVDRGEADDRGGQDERFVRARRGAEATSA